MNAIGEAIDGDWLWRRLEELAAFGARDDGGVCRLALSQGERDATRRLADWAGAMGASMHTDAIGNLFFRREGREDLTPVVTGSHIDTQPMGGRYDGAYGVLAGFALLEALARTGTTHRHPIEVVAWTNEEGARYSPGAMGSAAFTGHGKLEDYLKVADPDGVRLEDELAVTLASLDALGARRRDFGFPIHALVEAHIEQGPILEAEGVPVGVVTGVQGPAWYRVEVKGEAAHAGTTPRAARRDAFVGASELARAMREAAQDPEDTIRFTIGRFEVLPGAPNTVPDSVRFTVDLRHVEAATLDRLDGVLRELAAREWAGCTASLTRDMRLDPIAFPQDLVDAVEEAGAKLGIATRRILSGAFHDAAYLAAHCPSVMLFIPCARGVSHHPSESITPQDAAAGARVLAEAVLSLAGK